MPPISIKEDFRNKVSEKLELEQEGETRFRVLTPFRFEDGDHYEIVLKREGDRWILTDEANTLMHLSYWLDEKELGTGTRKQIMDSSLALFSVENREGELIIPVLEDRFGDALFSFVQALSKVTDVSFLSRDIVRSTFIEDFQAVIAASVPPERLEFNWVDQERDPKGNYPVDARINHMRRPLHVYALPSTGEKINVTMIALLTFEKWGVPFESLSIFEDQEEVPRKVLARFSDVAGKQFSRLYGNEEQIKTYLRKAIAV
jgi:hypothetical protein